MNDRPHADDLVIHHSSHSADVFLVSRIGERPQFSCARYEDALRHATHTAERLRVDVWYAKTPFTTYERVATFRRAEV